MIQTFFSCLNTTGRNEKHSSHHIIYIRQVMLLYQRCGIYFKNPSITFVNKLHMDVIYSDDFTPC